MNVLAVHVPHRFRPAVLSAIAVGWSLSFVWLWVTPASHEIEPVKSGSSDLVLYGAVAQQVHGGAPYYEAMGRELRQRGYPTQSAFNWRVPMPFWLFRAVPTLVWAKVLLMTLAGSLLLWVTAILLRDSGRIGVLCGAVAVAGAILPCMLGTLYVDPLLWAGTLIGLSICAEASQRRGWAIVFGITAALFRELAIGYCLVAALFAILERRRTVSLGWGLGLAIFAIYLGYHTQIVAAMNRGSASPLDISMWWHLKNPSFLVQCAQMNGFLLLLPVWVSYLYLSAAIAGLACCPTAWSQRAKWTTLGYLGGFLVVGHELNDYWGQLITVLLALGIGCLPHAWRKLRDWISIPLPNEIGRHSSRTG